MRSIPLADVRVAHALGITTGARGTVFHRFPAWAVQQARNPSFGVVASMPSGVRLELRTTSRRIELAVALTFVETDGELIAPAVFDLVADGAVVSSQRSTTGHRIVIDSATGATDLVLGEPTTIVFDDVPTAEEVAVWLPAGVVVELHDLRVDDDAVAGPPLPLSRRRWVHHGSSISHCLEADQPTGTWPAVAARLADVDLHSLAVAGQCQIDQFAARVIRDAPADLISLKLGINVVNGDTMRERAFVPAVHGFLDTVRDGHPDTPLVVATPIFCPSVEDRPGPTVPTAGTYTSPERSEVLATGALSLTRIRRLLTAIVDERRAAGDAHLHLVDGLQLFGPDDIDDLPDHLHPNAAGYRRLGERFHRLVFTGDGPFAG
jgi:hypothetical protein